MSALWEGEALPRDVGQAATRWTRTLRPPRASGCASNVTCLPLTASPACRVPGLTADLAEVPSQSQNTQVSGRSRRAGKQVRF